jgi:DnaJ-class molecular chaperone
MFNDARRQGGARRGQDERYTLAAGFLEAVNGANRRITLPNGHVLDVKIPVGTTDGQILRLRGQGGAEQGGEAGDALMEISIEPHAYFSRTGDDITLTLPVTIAEAVLGSEIEVPTPGGRVKMRIPPGADTGTKLRLRGKGVPQNGGLAAGDLYAILRVETGTPDAALENFLRAWKPEHAFNPRHGMEAQK